MAVKPFVLIVTDREKKEFCVEGPMVNDDPWNEEVVTAQKAGRQVNCHSPGETIGADVEKAAASYAREYGYKRVVAGSIVPRPGSLT